MVNDPLFRRFQALKAEADAMGLDISLEYLGPLSGESRREAIREHCDAWREKLDQIKRELHQ